MDALKSLGENSGFAYRKKIAAANGIEEYIGTAKQNIAMLALLKKGTLFFSDGDRGYVDGKAGTIKYSNGDVYEGGFKGDLRHGDGKYIWANGETYTGEFASGNMHGYGTYTWPEGRPSYTGYFKDGKIVVVDD